MLCLLRKVKYEGSVLSLFEAERERELYKEGWRRVLSFHYVLEGARTFL